MDASVPTYFNLFLYHKPVLHIDRQDDWLCLEIIKEIWDIMYIILNHSVQCMSLSNELTTV